MKANPFLVILLLSLATLLGAACNPDVDITPPEIEVLSFDPAPAEREVCGSLEPQVFWIGGGDSLKLDLLLKDDQELSQYKLDIHENFDCHGHAGKTEDWSLLEVVDISGTEFRLQRSLPVPEDVTAGNYHFGIQLVDAAGNNGGFQNIFSVALFNPADSIAPQLSLDEPAAAAFSLKRGETLLLRGRVEDNQPLGQGGNGRLRLQYVDEASGNRFIPEEWFFDPGSGTTSDFDYTFEIPLTWLPGSYSFSLYAFDGVNNAGVAQQFVIEVER
jgi:hypothetical protein